MNKTTYALAVLSLSLAACGPAPQSEPVTTAAPAAAAPVEPLPPPAAAASEPSAAMSALAVDPGSMADCTRIVANVRWDARPQHPEAAEVEVWVGPESSTSLFAAGGAHGEAKTGSWVMPGEIFRLRDKATGKELARFVMPGPACGKKAAQA